MAINPSFILPVQTVAPSASYPYGSARNDITVGDGSGTPLIQDWLNDLFGMQQALLVQAGLTPSGTPDNALTSQYVAAIAELVAQRDDVNALVNWRARTPYGSYSADFWAAEWFAAASQYVVVGQAGEQQYSPDGLAWSRATPGSAYAAAWKACAQNSTTLVAVGDNGEIQTTTTGTGYTHRANAGSYAGTYFDAASGASAFCIVGTLGRVEISPTSGTSWAAITLPGSPTETLRAVASDGASKLLVGGSNLYVSTNSGTSFSIPTTTGLPTSSRIINAIAYANGVWIISQNTGGTNALYASTDGGTTWADVTPSGFGGVSIYRIRKLGALFVGTGQNCAIVVSRDGLSWRGYKTTPNAGDVFRGVCLGSRGYVLAGLNGRLAQTDVVAR